MNATVAMQPDVSARDEPAPADLTITPTSVIVDSEGFFSRKVVIRLPAEMITDDLRNPKVFQRCQASLQHALKRYDEILCLAYDESFMVQAICTMADKKEAHLAILKVSSFRTVSEQLWTDGTVKVEWTGTGFIVVRCEDDIQCVNGVHATEQIAIQQALAWHATT